MANNRVTIHTCNDMLEADFLKSFLESHEIPVVLAQNRRMMAAITGNYSGLTRVSLEVALEDEYRALRLLEEAEAGKFEITEDFELDEEEVQAEEAPDPHHPGVCPSCGSTNVVEESKRGAAHLLVNLLFLGLPWLLGRRTWICADCHWHWTGEDAR